MKLAAIDIGSNAVRLLFSNVTEKDGEVTFKKSSLIRIPIRLGEDAFLTGKISEPKIAELVKTIKAFKLLIDVLQPAGFRACATSAMREASNGKDIVRRIKKETGLQIEIIDGKEEASLIFSNHTEETLDPDLDYLYIDVGGGSTELTLLSHGKEKVSRSFNVGTIRMLHEKLDKQEWTAMKKWIRDHVGAYQEFTAIGSGGNINKLYKLSDQKPGKPLSIEKLKELTVYLSRMTYEERINDLGLNPDRADVIIPAGKIFHTIMKAGNIRKIVVPQIGLADGIVHELYEELCT